MIQTQQYKSIKFIKYKNYILKNKYILKLYIKIKEADAIKRCKECVYVKKEFSVKIYGKKSKSNV